MNHAFVRPLILALDTTTPTQHLALAAGAELLVDWRLPIQTSHSETLLPHIDDCLRRHGLSGRDLDGLAAVNGPGSFTGIRIGLATIQGLADNWLLPLWSRNALELCALHPGVPDGVVCPVLPAGRGGLYYAVFRREGPELIPLHPAGEFRAGDIPDGLAKLPEATLLGPGAPALAAALPGDRPAVFPLPAEPSPAAILALDAARSLRGGNPPPPRLEAFYIRPPDAKKSARWRGAGHER